MNETVEALIETREQLIANCNATAQAYARRTGKRMVISPGIAAAFRDGGLDMTLFEIERVMPSSAPLRGPKVSHNYERLRAGLENVQEGVDSEAMAKQEAYDAYRDEWPK